MPDRIVFNVAIPRADEFTGQRHSPQKSRSWFWRTAELEFCRGGSQIGVAILGLWFEHGLPPGAAPVQDFCDWYKFAVPPDRVEDLGKHVELATQEFGQKCIYLERAGEADFIANPNYRSAG